MVSAILPRLNSLLNPFTDDPEVKVGLGLPGRLLRAFLISARNTAFFVAALIAGGLAFRQLPDYGALVLPCLGALLIYGWIRYRDRRGVEAAPVFSLALFFVMVVAMADLRALVDDAQFRVRFNYVIEGDKLLFGGHVPTTWLQEQLFSSRTLGPLEVACVLVYVSYFFLPFIAAIFLWHAKPTYLRVYLVAMFLANSMGDAYFAAVPTAPPWLASSSGHIGSVTRIVRYFLEQFLPGTYERGYQAVGVNDVASFPSFHMAESLIPLLAILLLKPHLKRLALVYIAVMGFSLVYLGEHYAVDVIAGIALGWFAWVGAVRLTPLLFGVANRGRQLTQRAQGHLVPASLGDAVGE